MKQDNLFFRILNQIMNAIKKQLFKAISAADINTAGTSVCGLVLNSCIKNRLSCYALSHSLFRRSTNNHKEIISA